jgi:hypothetical protein
LTFRSDVTSKAQVVNRTALWVCLVVLALIGLLPRDSEAQQTATAGGPQAQGRATGAPQSARASAPKDFTGYWVSVVTEQWNLRMLMPPKGEYSMLPLNAEGRAVADAWTRERDAGNECQGYGAAVIMRVPGRLHIHWADDDTLQIDTDSGTQTRLLHFGASARPPADAQLQWQGYSVAAWAGTAMGRGAKVPGPAGNLRVVTTQMKAGYLRKNGVPYSEKATLEEYFDTLTEPDGNSWLVVSSIVTDMQYLTGPYAWTVHFKKVPDGQGWDPTPCRTDQVR